MVLSTLSAVCCLMSSTACPLSVAQSSLLDLNLHENQGRVAGIPTLVCLVGELPLVLGVSAA